MVFIDDFNPVSATLGNAGAEMWESKCKCLLNWPEREVEQWDLLQESVVGVNAVDFCSTLFEDFDAQQKITHHSWDRGHLDNKKAFITREVEPKLTTDLCKKKLRDSRKVDLILQGASDSFKKVCQDECEDLVKALRAQTAAIASFGTERFGSYSMACSLYAVKKIESRLLGCCGNSCGWNGKTCTLWPFFTSGDQVAWKEECCAEKHFLKGSEREHMCESVLAANQRHAYANLDLPAQDEGVASFVGEDEELVWTDVGAASRLAAAGWAVAGQVIPDGFLRVQPLSVQEGLKLNYWKIRKKSFASLLQSERSGPQAWLFAEREPDCDTGEKKIQTCHVALKRDFLNKCKSSQNWRVSGEDITPCLADHLKTIQNAQQCAGEGSTYFQFQANEPIHCYKPTCSPLKHGQICGAFQTLHQAQISDVMEVKYIHKSYCENR